MKTAIALGLLATTVMSKPFIHKHHKRDWAFAEATDTVFTTVTAGGSSGWSWGSWGGSWGSWNGPASSTAAAVPVVTETPLSDGFPTPPPAAPAPEATVWTTVNMPAPAPSPSAPEAPPSAPPAPAPEEGSAPSAASSGWGSTSTAAAGSEGTGPGGIDIAAILNQHNLHRANHSASALTWDTNLANIAAQIASSCVYAHNTQAGGGGYGQNIGAGTSAADVPAMITNEMYNDEFGFYPQPWGQNNPDMTNFEQWGHLSQIVWASTTSVGCAWQDCSSQGLANVGSGVGAWFTVCNYGPPGNFGGEYSNVHAPQGQPVVSL